MTVSHYFDIDKISRLIDRVVVARVYSVSDSTETLKGEAVGILEVAGSFEDDFFYRLRGIPTMDVFNASEFRVEILPLRAQTR